MNSIHDMGGMHGFGPVEREADEPVFHATWEGRAFAIGNMAGAALGFSVDQKRHAQERMGNVRYLASSYYERWMSAIETLAVELGAITPAELADGRLRKTGFAPVYKLPAERVETAMRKGRSKRRDLELAPAFSAGQAVRTITANPTGHTRLPRYARGCSGTVLRDQGVFVFPDSLGNDGDEAPQHVYAVRFEGRKLWGPDSDPALAVHLDLFESYLSPA